MNINAHKSNEASYQMVEIQENAEICNNETATSNFNISSLRNACEAVKTTVVNAGKWIVAHPIPSVVAGSTLLGLVIGIPTALANSKRVGGIEAVNCTELSNTLSSNVNKSTSFSFRENESMNCTELSNTLSFNVNKSTSFSFRENGTVLAQLTDSHESARLDLDMTEFCSTRTEELLTSDFTLACGEQEPIIFRPSELKNQAKIDGKLIGTQCDPSINASLIFKGQLVNTGKSQSSFITMLDTQKMCEEGKIKDFKAKDFTYEGSEGYSFEIRKEPNLAIDEYESTSRSPTVYEIDVSSNCASTVDTEFKLICNQQSYTFTPKFNLTAEAVKSLDFGACTASASEKASKSCELTTSRKDCKDIA